jgi:hypothetical protein
MTTTTATIAKTARKAEKIIEATVTPLPVSVATTSTNVVVKFSKQYAVAVVGTAALTAGTLKAVEIYKARKLIKEIQERNEL